MFAARAAINSPWRPRCNRILRSRKAFLTALSMHKETHEPCMALGKRLRCLKCTHAHMRSCSAKCATDLSLPISLASLSVRIHCSFILFAKLTKERRNEGTMKINEHRWLICFLVNVVSACF